MYLYFNYNTHFFCWCLFIIWDYAMRLAVHSGPAVSHSSSLFWLSQCWVPEVQHRHVSAGFSISLCLQILLIQILIFIFKCFHNFFICVSVGVRLKSDYSWSLLMRLSDCPESNKDLLVYVPQPRGVTLCRLPSFSRGLEPWTHLLMFVCHLLYLKSYLSSSLYKILMLNFDAQ